jgi:PAS domain S-box-containing protein
MIKKTILIVDDTYENLYLLRVILEEVGYHVIEANDGSEGLKKLYENNNVDLIISDILMPVMDGFMFCQACKEEKLFKNIPFVFYTSTYTERLDEDFALKLGAAKYLRKPIDHDEVISTVKNILGKESKPTKQVKRDKITNEDVLKLYSERLINKLEQKSFDLEREIEVRKKAEKLLIHKNEVLDLIAHSTPLSKVFDHILLNYESNHKNYQASISLMNEDGIHLELVSAPSMPQAYNLAIKRAKIGKKAGSCGTAAFTKKLVIVSDISKDKLWEDYRDIALKHNLKSCWSIPILSKNNIVLGTFAIYGKEVNSPSDEEIVDLNYVVNLALVAIEKAKIVAEIKKRDESYKSLVNQASDAIVTYSLEGDIFDFNKVAYTVLGYTKNEFSKLTIQNIIQGDFIASPERHEKILKGKPVLFERQLICKDGTLIDTEISAKLQTDGRILGIIRNITERKKAELKLQESEKSLLSAQKLAKIGSYNYDFKAQIVHGSSSYREIVGVESDTVITLDVWKTISHPDDTDSNKKILDRCVETGEIFDVEYRIFTKNKKELKWIHGIGEVVYANGEATNFFGTIQDITERKQSEIALKAAKEFSEKLIMSMQEGLLIVDLSGKIIMVNNSLSEMLGYKKEELIGLDLPYPFAKMEDLELMLEIKDEVASGETKSFQLEFFKKNGDKFLASFLSGNILNDKGEVIALFGTIKDVTEEDKAKRILEETASKSILKKNVIMELSGLVGSDYNESLQRITALSAATLNVARVGIWKFIENRTGILCEKLHVLKTGKYESGVVLYKKDNPNYFDALAENQTINVEHAVTNNITKGFAKDYLIPFGITSMLDVFIQGNQEPYGVICFEHIGEPKLWTEDDQEFASTIASIVSLMVESNERKAAEDELKTEKEFSEKLITSLNEGLSVVDINGVHIKVNAALCKMTGFTEDELVGIKAPFPYWPPEEYENIYKAFNNPLDNLSVNKEAILMRKNGERFPVSLSDSVIKNKEGNVIAYFTTITDITLRVKANNILKESIRISNQRKNIIIELANLIGEDLNESLQKIASTSALALNVDLVTIWEYKNDKSELLSKVFFKLEEQEFDSEGLVIKKEDFPDYFNAFKNEHSINISDVNTNPITKAFAKKFFLPNNISSRIDVLIYGRSDHYGIISFESKKVNRVFTNEEESFVTSIASIVSLMVESYERKQAENELVTTNDKLLNANTELNKLKKELEEQNVYLREEIDLVFNYEEMVYGSAVFSNVLTDVELVAATNATVLLLGESGTGKELLARAIHNTSPRKNKPLIKVNCAAIPKELIESELFGHKKGSFTGAINDKIGKFKLADGGTLFLDEIGELPIDMQPKLLRAIQESEIEQIGSTETQKVDIRIIAATNRNLKVEVEEKRFRSDLFFRLNVFPIVVPPLRDRVEDIPILIEHFVDKFSKAYNKDIKFMSEETKRNMQEYSWPGNIRELENLIERAVILSQDKTLVLPNFETGSEEKLISSTVLTLDEAQRLHIIKILKKCNWKIDGSDGAAQLLEIKPSTLRDRMKKLGIKKPD